MSLSIHKILQWVASLGVVVIGYYITTNINTWQEVQKQLTRMEDVPTDIKDIKYSMESTNFTVQNHEFRITAIEREHTKSDHR